MDNPKTYMLVFSGFIALLVLLLLIKQTDENTVSATVLTQSLDGQRRYLTINSPEIEQQRVTVPVSASCPVGSIALFHQASRSSLDSSLSFIRCE
ncbi:hypothetical protein [Vibrio diabolicus]|uniref:hypothetical protein n=1 Tax=Vibrio diabolicus TaxID=50719 RepID=UPI0015F56A32|nr:hypothetical protein [Vibrio diabolicus]